MGMSKKQMAPALHRRRVGDLAGVSFGVSRPTTERREMSERRDNEYVERLAAQTADLDLENAEDRSRFFELIGQLTREDLLRLAEIHQRRAYGEFE